MNEYTVILVIVTLVGLFVTVGKPIINLNTNIVELGSAVKGLQKTVDKLEKKQEDDNAKVWDRLARGEVKFDNHEKRITNLEEKK
jgi:hypothetical protein